MPPLLLAVHPSPAWHIVMPSGGGIHPIKRDPLWTCKSRASAPSYSAVASERLAAFRLGSADRDEDAELLRLVSLARPPAHRKPAALTGSAGTFLPQSACFLGRASGDARCRWTLHYRRRGVRVGEALVRVGVRSIPFGIAAVVLGFVLKSPGTQAGPADIGLRAERPGISVFGTIHPKIFRLRAPIGSQPMADRVRVASLGPQV